MKHGSLFSGVGGFDLAAQWMGWENVFHCEWNPFGQKVLNYYWPNAISYNDITRTDFSIHRGTIDILTGGFPCQPYSAAGKRLGKEDARHLWPEMLRAIREISPRYVVGENVRGLTNWNGGMVFDEVQADLESEGYEVLPFLHPACGVNAPHRRDRIWFIAHNNSARLEAQGTKQQTARIEQHRELGRITSHPKSERSQRAEFGKQPETCREKQGEFGGNDCENASADTDSRRQSSEEHGETKSGRTSETSLSPNWENWPTQPPVCGGDDGLPTELDGAAIFGKEKYRGTPFGRWRNESIKAYGNAIVPQVALNIFKAIQQYEHQVNGY